MCNICIYILAVQRTTRLTAHISLWVKMTFLWCICCNQRCNQITATTWVSSLRLWSMSAKMHFILLWTIASCRFWQAHPPTRNSNAKLLFCMVVDAAISSLFCRFCSQPVLGCCFNNSSLKCWLHHLSMTLVVPSLHLYGTPCLCDFSQRWEGGAEITQRWSFGPITAVTHPPPIQTAFLLFCISCWNATKIASCRFWQAHPPTRNSNAKLLFCMVVDAAISSLFCRFCSQPVLGCCFNNSSLKCWLHHLSMTPVVPSLRLQWLCRTTGKLPRTSCIGLSLTYTWVWS